MTEHKIIQLRDYQERVVTEVRRLAANGSRRILVVLPTGAGKTHVMASLASAAINKGNKVLAQMHRRGLVEQMAERFDGCGIDSGFIMAGKEFNQDVQCQIASLFTYARRLKLAEKEYNQFWIDAPVLLIDEGHHVLSKTYQTILKQYPNAFVIGCTATPTLSTGAGLGNYFDSMVNVVEMGELLDGGYLVPGEYYGPTEQDLSSLKIIQGDYEKKGLDEKCNRPEIVGSVVENWLRVASGLQTMVFGINRKHSKALNAEFCRHGVRSEYLDAHNSDDERNDVLRRFRDGDTQVICQVALYSEGTDIPEIFCLVIARPTKSIGLHRQILGRGARPYPGKESFLVLDHGGNVRRLGYYEDEIDWTLDGKKASNQPKKKRVKEKTILKCEYCDALITGSRCPNCGNEIKDYGKKIAVIEAELVRLEKSKIKKLTMDDKRRWYAMLDYERRRLGKSEKWLLANYRQKAGCWPRGMDDVHPIPADREVLGWLQHRRIAYAKRMAKNAQT